MTLLHLAPFMSLLAVLSMAVQVATARARL